MKHTILSTVILAFVALSLPRAFAADAVLPKSAPSISELIEAESSNKAVSERRAYRNWQISLIPLFASQALDVSSSYGMREANPLLSTPAGTFDAKSSIIKFGVVGALVGAEYLVIRKHPGAAKALWKLNYGSAAAVGAVAMRNYAIR